MNYCGGLTAKFWALCDGLQIAHHTGLRDLEVETDAREIIQPLKDLSMGNHCPKNITCDCRLLNPEVGRGDQARV